MVAMVAHRTGNRGNSYPRGRGDQNGGGRNNYNSYNCSWRAILVLTMEDVAILVHTMEDVGTIEAMGILEAVKLANLKKDSNRSTMKASSMGRSVSPLLKQELANLEKDSNTHRSAMKVEILRPRA
ncbi:hypothetical protein EJ110_NYTH42465 [Nymphaea thermarum]|nr:hypothetical protein EJ110_NYTH42465 [Nymphaea thermarum]